MTRSPTQSERAAAKARAAKERTAKERAALDRAAEQYVYWNTDNGVVRPPVNPKLLATVRQAARELHRALTPLVERDGQPTAQRLALRMQEYDKFAAPASAYGDELVHLFWRTLVLDLSCAAEVVAGRKADPRVVEWICRAADEWVTAGGTASAKHRFGRALIDYRAAGIPPVTGIAVIEGALVEWKRWKDSRVASAGGGVESGGALGVSSD